MEAIKLKVLKNGSDFKEFEFNPNSKRLLILGRKENADIAIDDRAISREHAALEILDDGLLRIQKKTPYGDFLHEGTAKDQVDLKPGEVIDFAQYRLEFLEKKQPEVSIHKTELLESDDKSSEKTSELKLDEPLQDAPVEISPEQIEDRTVMVSSVQIPTKVQVKKSGQTVFDLTLKSPQEYKVGRAPECDIVLDDVDASRFHGVLEPSGPSYIYKDLGSSNGSYVGSEKIQEKILEHGDVIRIGETELHFEKRDELYQAQEQDFLKVEQAAVDEPIPTLETPLTEEPPSWDHSDNSGLPPQEQLEQNFLTEPPKKLSLLDRFKALPPKRKIIVGVLALGLLLFLLDDSTQTPNKKNKGPSKIDPSEIAFKKLPKEKREYIVQTYQRALDLYMRREYERALLEIQNLKSVLPNLDYKDAKDIGEYARRGMEQLKAQSDEKKRQEEAEQKKKMVSQWEQQAQQFFNEKKYSQAEELFPKILEIDPDSEVVSDLKKKIHEEDLQKRKEEEKHLVELSSKRLMLDAIQKGKNLRSEGKYYEAIHSFEEATQLGQDPDLLKQARGLISLVQNEIKRKRDPLLASAQAALAKGEYEKSRDHFLKAKEIDPKCKDCDLGILSIRQQVKEKAQKIYIEAVLSESVSDLATAKSKYLECYKASIPEDEYYGRCWRKYHRFVTIDSGDSIDKPNDGSEASDLSQQTADDSQKMMNPSSKRDPASEMRVPPTDEDPYTQEILESL